MITEMGRRGKLMKARGAIRIPVAEGDESSQASIRMCSYRFKKALSDISLDKP